MTSFGVNPIIRLSLENQNIEELISGCRQKNQKAEFEIYRRYSKAMYNIALRIIKDAHFAEDVMQEGFLKAFLKIDDYRRKWLLAHGLSESSSIAASISIRKTASSSRTISTRSCIKLKMKLTEQNWITILHNSGKRSTASHRHVKRQLQDGFDIILYRRL